MKESAQSRALKSYRKRLSQRGIMRFEVLGVATDRELLRRLAQRLAGNDDEAHALRETLLRSLKADPPAKGGILAALRRSPLVGADLVVTRDQTHGRDIEL